VKYRETMTEGEILEAADMAETYPGSGVLNMEEIGIDVLVAWCRLVDGKPGYENAMTCDVILIVQMFRWWWQQQKKGGGE